MKYFLPLFLLLTVVAPLLLSSCGGEEPSYTTEKAYEVKGRYLSTDMRGESISIVHETVPDVMNAMRMNMRIDAPDVAADLQTGDVIRFDMVQTEMGWFARNIVVLPPDTELDLPENLREMGLHE